MPGGTIMPSFFLEIFDTSDFPARWHCGNWSEAHGWLHVLSDLAIGAAYMSIPLAVLLMVLRDDKILFPRIGWLFAAFIFSCGTVHLIEAGLFWWPAYRLSGSLKATTAVVSWATVFALLPMLAKTFRTPRLLNEHQHMVEELGYASASRRQLVKANEQLQRQIEFRNRAHEAAWENEELFATTFLQASIGIAHVAPDGTFLRVNPALCGIVGYSSGELLQLSFQEITHPDDIDADIEYARQLIAGEIETYSMEKRYTRKDGSIVWILLSVSLVRGPKGLPKYFISYIQDYQKLKSIEMELRKGQERLGLALDASGGGMWDMDFRTGKNYWDANTKKLHGLEDENFDETFKSFLECVHPGDRSRLAKQIRAATIQGREEFATQYRVAAQNGSVRFLEARGKTVTELGVPVHLTGICWNITKRKKSEKRIKKLNGELQNQALRLQQVNEELESFAYSVSHDLMSPLRSIEGFSRIIHEDYKDLLDEKGEDYLARICSATSRMGSLIDDLLNLSKVTRQPVNISTFDISTMANDILEELKNRDPLRNVSLTVQDEMAAWGDAALCRVALQNMLENAWKYTKKTEGAKIEFGRMRIEDEDVFFVRDNGVGFDMHFADKLFVPFQRLHRADEFDGTGIGLASVQRIIRRHGGKIWADSVPEQGAAFYFTLGSGLEGAADDKDDLVG